METTLPEDFEPVYEPTPTPAPKKKVSKKEEPCKDCPDYTQEDLLREKVILFREKGYNDNQIAAMLMVQKSLVKQVLG